MNTDNSSSGISFVIMPIEILQDKNLTQSEKILYCYLSVFKKGVCFQSNEALSEMTGIDERTVQRGIKKLSEMKYVFVEFVNNNSAARRIYTVLDNPDKIAYLARKGMFSLDRDRETKETPEPVPAPSPKPAPKCGKFNPRPKRSDYETEEDFEEAFYLWNNETFGESSN